MKYSDFYEMQIDCDKEFQTCRSTKHQISDVSALAGHAWNNDHHVDWDNTRGLSKDNRLAQRKWIEAWHIACTRGAIANRDQGRVLPEAYIPLVNTSHSI